MSAADKYRAFAIVLWLAGHLLFGRGTDSYWRGAFTGSAAAIWCLSFAERRR